MVDAAAMDLLRRPDEFDVLVASNLFGDVPTDLAAAVTGRLGLAPSASVDPGGDGPGTSGPVHGSAPDVADPDAPHPGPRRAGTEGVAADLGTRI